MLHRHTSIGTRWLTLLALLLATLAPGVAHALRHARGEMLPWTQICSATGGMRRIVVPGEQPGQVAHTFERCAACALHLDASTPPSAPAATVARSDLAHALPAPLPHAPRTLHAWSSAQPRAPPAA